MKIGVLTGGGDCPGLNAVIRAVVRKAHSYGSQVIGVRNGWEGLLNNTYIELDSKTASGILHLGGTIIGTSRTNPFNIPGGPETVMTNFRLMGLEGLVVIGGEGTMGGTARFSEMGLPVVGVPKTIDNDLFGTDFTFGFDTAVSIATEAIDRIHTTAESHHRVMLVEVMGRDVGWIAIYAGLAGGADPRLRAVRIGYENSVLNYLIAHERLDLVHWFANTCSRFTPAASVVTVYDLQAIPLTSARARLRAVYLNIMMKNTVRHAARLLPMSEATASELATRYGVQADWMAVVPPIVNDGFVPSSSQCISEFRQQFDLPAQFWLYVAHLYSHKNHERLLRAYAYMKDAMGVNLWPLVLRGDPKDAKQDLRAIVNDLGLQHCVVMLPRLDAQQLPALYSAASALVFPSLYEGGGIPIVEAMACGCPIAASSIPSVLEYGKDAPVYFNPEDVAAIGSTMLAFQNSPDARDRGRQLGLLYSAQYRKTVVLKGLLSVYRSVSHRT